ncbi:TIGR01620 family protein [Lacimicrobium sp. SS2-24]|uniref:YcjF family protein n=1 Tax=Lacimicrobium sp. SS2-24 TaxID=2005569 RepID=UPI000B4AD667|nr:TIGR01620 family protein [Lacimicrobium sp. SS2-24]
MSQHTTSSELRPAVRIEASESPSSEADNLRPAMHVEEEAFKSEPEPPDDEGQSNKAPPGKLFWFTAAVLVMSLVQLAVSLYAAFTSGAWLGLVWLVILTAAGALAGIALVREWQAFTQLEQRNHWQEQGRLLANSPAIGEARSYCQELATHLPESAQPLVTQWQATLQPHYADKEVMALFEQQVLSVIDQRVVTQISRESGASAMMIALSPFATLDMLLVLWRNLKMINQISHSYGVKTGYWARIRLIRNMCHNIIYAGASELAADASVWALGGSLSARLSSRVAQGLGAGVLTARMGVQAARLCRPMAFIHSPSPNISRIASSVLERLRAVDSQSDKKTHSNP